MGPVQIAGFITMANEHKIWGNHFEIDGRAKLKVPGDLKKEIAVRGLMGTAKDVDYFFVRLAYSGQGTGGPFGADGIGVKKLPIHITELSGAFYKNIKKQSGSAFEAADKAAADKAAGRTAEYKYLKDKFPYRPDAGTGFGGSIAFNLADVSSKGAEYFGGFGGEFSYTEGGNLSYLELQGSVNFNNWKEDIVKSTFSVKGRYAQDFYKDLLIIHGAFTLNNKTAPYTIDNASATYESRGSDWRVDIGTEKAPVIIGVRKFGKLKGEGYLSVSNKATEFGLGVRYNVSYYTPWVETTLIDFRVGVAGGFRGGVQVGVGYEDDKFPYLQKMKVRALVQAALKVDYQTAVRDGSIDVASAMLAGEFGYSQTYLLDKGVLAGKLKGRACFLDMCADFEVESGNIIQ
jgi:hypothetical protein